MKDKKLQVFVSSTYADLREERQAAVEAILSSGNIPAGMELFCVDDKLQMTIIERWIDESDVYLLILGGRYGTVEAKTGKSYTHLEYEYALAKGKPLFAAVINDDALRSRVTSIGVSAIEQEYCEEYIIFKSTVLNNPLKFWDTKKDIKIAIHETLAEFRYRKELVGWIRGDNNINSRILAEEIARLTKENSELRNKNTVKENIDTSSYANLTYYQLEVLLKREKVEIDGMELDLFHYLLMIGNELVNAYDPGDKVKIISKLKLYKLVKHKAFGIYIFTEDGHNFYLMALLLNAPRLNP